MAECKGRNLDDICCITQEYICPYLEQNTEPGFRWSCGLRRELGSWDAVEADPRYIEGPGKQFARYRVICRDWPDVSIGHACAKCGSGMEERGSV